MNGAEKAIETLLAKQVDTCFANPGTSEMHLVASLDAVPGMRCVLVLFEGVATGAADGYARIAGKPAVTLLHLGPGLGNALANLHNAKKAHMPMVNIVGDHATRHRQYEAPLTSDVMAVAAPMSDWVKSCTTADNVAADVIEAVEAAGHGSGAIATLILPADCAWDPVNTTDEKVAPLQERPAQVASDTCIKAAARYLSEPGERALFVGGAGLVEPGLTIAARIAAKTGARLMGPTGTARAERGAGRPVVTRIPYPVDMVLELTASLERIVLCGTGEPVAFFAYPGKPSLILPDTCERYTLAAHDNDILATLRALEARLEAADTPIEVQERTSEVPATGAMALEGLGRSLAALIPQDAILVDEMISSSFVVLPLLKGAAAHDHLQLTGGAIGDGLPLALGASVAAPERQVVCLQADGSGMYTLQALWSMARENCNVTIVIFSNGTYETLNGELRNVGVVNAGPNALSMIDIAIPRIDWVALSQSLGVKAERCTDLDHFNVTFAKATTQPGPYLIEAVLP